MEYVSKNKILIFFFFLSVFASLSAHGEIFFRTTSRLVKGFRNHHQENIVYSPCSINYAFYMALAGADGETLEEMQQYMKLDALHLNLNEEFDKKEETHPSIYRFANRLYASHNVGFIPSFLQYSKKLLKEVGADATLADFSNPDKVANEINSFVEETTFRKIKDMVSPDDFNDMTSLVLVNALYFKSSWAVGFDPHLTVKDTFYTRDEIGRSNEIIAEFMKRMMLPHERTLYYCDEELTALAIPYQDIKIALFVFMPSDITEFENKVADEKVSIDHIVKIMRMDEERERKIELHLPKFSMKASQNKFDLKQTFQNLGQAIIFDPNRADFSKITGDKSLFVSKFIHEAFIEVDENGTEAGAATAAIMMMRMAAVPTESLIVKFNKPFFFQIRWNKNNVFSGDHGNDVVLFQGRVSNPVKVC